MRKDCFHGGQEWIHGHAVSDVFGQGLFNFSCMRQILPKLTGCWTEGVGPVHGMGLGELIEGLVFLTALGPAMLEMLKLARLPLEGADIASMSASPNQSCFLRRLLQYEGSPASRELCDRLAALERNESSLACACRLVGLIAMLGFAGLGYGAVLLPQFFDNSTHIVIRLSGAIGLGSAACLVIFLALWFSCRFSGRRLRAECRMAVSKMLAERLPGFVDASAAPVIREGPQLRVELPRRGNEGSLEERAPALIQPRAP